MNPSKKCNCGNSAVYMYCNICEREMCTICRNYHHGEHIIQSQCGGVKPIPIKAHTWSVTAE